MPHRVGHSENRGTRILRTLWCDPDALERTLRATLADDRFSAGERTARLLVYLVRRTIAGEAGPIDPACVALDSCTSSGPRTPDDPALRVLLTRSRRLLEERRARVGDEQPVLRLCPQSYVVVELPPAIGDRDDDAGTDGAGCVDSSSAT